METNKNQKSTIKKLLLAKDDKTSKYDDLDNKLQTVKPVKQTLTSNEVDPNVIDISYCVPGSSTKNSMSASHSNLIKKRKFDLENTQLNSSLSFYPNKETKIEKGRDIFTSDSNLNKELFVKSSGNRDVSLNSSLTHKDLKINFMRASNVFPPKSDIKKNSEFNKENNSKSNSLAKKFSGSIIHNYSTHKNLYSSGKQEIFTVPVGKGGKSYKNAVSELNTSAVIKKPNNATSTQIKIVGLVGRSKVNNENADQSKSTIGKLIEWVPKNKKNLSVDKKLNSELSFASQNTADSFNKNSKVNSNVNSTKLPVKTLKTSSSNINLSDSAQSFNKFKSQSISGNISSSSTKNRNNGNYKFLNLLKNKA